MAPRSRSSGTGAIGATVAAALQQNGHGDLVLAGRTPRERIVVEPDGVELGPLVTEPAGAAADWVFLAVKVHQTEGAAAWLARSPGRRPSSSCSQNGVEHRGRRAALAHRRPDPAHRRVGAGRGASSRAGWCGAARST